MNFYRTWLFVPGNQDWLMEKARQLNVDVIIYDLEMAVGAEQKEQARADVYSHLQQRTFTNKMSAAELPVELVRVHPSSSTEWEQDLRICVRAGVSGIVLSKTENKRNILKTDERLAALEIEYSRPLGNTKILPLIETALGVYNSFQVAAASKRVGRLLFGALHYTAELGATCTAEGNELLYARTQLLNSSAAAAIKGPVDTVYPHIEDEEGLVLHTESGKQLGFQGKIIVHPKQIDTVNAVYTPSPQTIQEAVEIVKAYEEAVQKGQAVLLVNGRLIDESIARQARQLLSRVQQVK